MTQVEPGTQRSDIWLRQARFEDHAALRRVCVLTADSGNDASAIEDDPDLVGLIYAVPYQVYAPEYAVVVADADGVCGYALGAPDTAAFERHVNSGWFPEIARSLSDPGPDESVWTGSDWARRHIHHPPALVYPVLDAFPAHGHIDLLERARGRGMGRKAMEWVLHRLAKAGCPGIHLGVAPDNDRALAFYGKLGFKRLDDPSLPQDTVYVVRGLSDFA